MVFTTWKDKDGLGMRCLAFCGAFGVDTIDVYRETFNMSYCTSGLLSCRFVLVLLPLPCIVRYRG